MSSLPAPPGYERNQLQRQLPRAPCPNSCLIPQPAPTRPQGKAGWAAEGSRAFLAFLFLLGTASLGEPVPEAGSRRSGFTRANSRDTHPPGQPAPPVTPPPVPATSRGAKAPPPR